MTRRHRTLAAGMAILATAIFLLIRQPRSATSTIAKIAEQSEITKRRTAEPVPKPRSPATPPQTLPNLPHPVESPYPPGAAENREWIETRSAELDRLAWFDDSQSLEKILAELRNPLPEIRAAALAATLAFSSRESVPYLEALAKETHDPTEKKALTDAIEYLMLPTMVEELDKLPPDSGESQRLH